jgi:hypothetical protein
MHKRSPYTWAAIVVLALPVVAEGARLVLNRPWPGFVPWNSHLISTVVVLMLGATIVEMFRGVRVAVAERMLALFAPLVLAGHALALTVAKDRIGFLYMVVAAVYVFLAQRAFRAEGRDRRHPPSREVLRGRVS